jgi:long-chain acyl-CoA synthetase|tara:strand:+ start:2202 stop:3881 length:1680 start_codon:yes stop_codon:yes gene_type:complete
MEKIWIKNYPPGVSESVNLVEYQSFADLLDEGFSKFSNSIAFENMGKSITYKELDILSQQFSLYLTETLKMKKGDRLAIQSPNVLQYPIALFGALRSGIIVVNTNPLYTPSEMKHQFNDSGCKAILILSNFAYNLEKIISKTKIQHVIVSDMGDMLGTLKGGLVNFVVKYVKKMVPKFSLPSAVSFKKALSIGGKYQFKKHKIFSDDIAFLQYTGGTTGVSKGAMLSNYNVLSNMIQVSECMDILLKEKKEIVITALPLYHIFALVCNALVMFKYGAKNILITNPRDMDGFIKELSKYNFSVITGVNTLFNGLLNNKKFKNLNFSKLKVAFGGGMAVQESVAIKWNEVTGCPLVEGYGLTETSPVVTINPLDGTNKIGSIGLPIPNTEIKFIDDKNKEVPVGERGEICVKGPQVMVGYWNRKEATDEVIKNGWLITGDIGVIDNQGFIQIVDRKKEMVLVSGFNVFPNEVEHVISSHPKVLEVGVIGVPDKKTSEAVKAVIVKKDESLTEEEIKLHCKQKLTNYKCPKHVSFTDELPKSNVGKILRRIIKEKDLELNSY